MKASLLLYSCFFHTRYHYPVRNHYNEGFCSTGVAAKHDIVQGTGMLEEEMRYIFDDN